MRARAEFAAQEKQERVDAQNDHLTRIRLAASRIQRAWIIGAIFGVIFGPIAGFALSADTDSQSQILKAILLVPTMAGVYFYVGWCFSWSIPVVWRWCRQLVAGLGCGVYGGCAFWVLLLSVLIAIPFTVAYLYGIFGGAIYEYRKAKRLINGVAKPQATAVGAG
jgi:hypothetical protein